MRPVGIFVHLTGRMDDEGAGHDRNVLRRRAHRAAAFETEIDLGGVRMAMIGADLTRLPAGDGHIAGFDPAENFFDMFLRIEFGLIHHTKNLHGSLLGKQGAARMRQAPRYLQR